MKNKQNTLLAGVAALALLAGTGLASAQDHQDHGNAATKAAQSAAQTPSASPAAPSAAPAKPQASQGAGPGQQAQKADKGNTSTPQGAAAALRGAKTGPAIARGNDAKAPHSAAAPPSKQRASTAQNEHGRRSGMRSAEERNVAIPKGLRSDASKPMQGDQAQAKGSVGGDVKLSDRQRTTIRDTVLHGRSAPRVGHVDFNVRVGTIVPRNDIHVVPVPETLVRIEPRWHGYLYFVYEDEIVIVNPRDMTIVAVLEA
jgi:hypothetical protein